MTGLSNTEQLTFSTHQTELASIRVGMWFSTNILSVILRLNVFFVGKVEFIVVGLGLRMHSNLVSAMELALMGGWPTKDGRAGSEAFEFIPKGSGRKPGAAEAIFFARDLVSI